MKSNIVIDPHPTSSHHTGGNSEALMAPGDIKCREAAPGPTIKVKIKE